MALGRLRSTGPVWLDYSEAGCLWNVFGGIAAKIVGVIHTFTGTRGARFDGVQRL
jgi:hypothetical protein